MRALHTSCSQSVSSNAYWSHQANRETKATGSFARTPTLPRKWNKASHKLINPFRGSSGICKWDDKYYYFLEMYFLPHKKRLNFCVWRGLICDTVLENIPGIEDPNLGKEFINVLRLIIKLFIICIVITTSTVKLLPSEAACIQAATLFENIIKLFLHHYIILRDSHTVCT